MTGRKGRVVSNDDGTITYESRSELDVPVEILNLTEKQRFMDGEKVNTFVLGLLCQKCNCDFCWFVQRAGVNLRLKILFTISCFLHVCVFFSFFNYSF